MKLILDEGLPLRSAAFLREAGIYAWHVIELRMGGASDQAILDRAINDGAIIATLDSDFHKIMASTAAKGPSVVRIRIEGLRAENLADLLLAVIEQAADELNAGALASVSRQRIRLRKLPIRR